MLRSPTADGLKHPPACCCPACAGLECLTRPRFFPGQVLREADLNAALDYVRAKNRLHNRHLHGPGVVCGLEVFCGACDGTVTVTAGYAIDPCGNDVVVCADTTFDVLQAVRDCCQSRRRAAKDPCNPYVPTADDACKDIDQHWCITLEYQETEARPVTAVRTGAKATCGCGGGGGCGCGCGGAKAKGNGKTGSCSPPNPSGSSPAGCEPTRVVESFRLGVVEGPKDHCLSPASLLDGTLYQKVRDRLQSLTAFLRKRLTPAAQQFVLAVAAGNATPQVAPQTAFEACCRLRQAVVDLFRENPFNVRCQALRALDGVHCTPPPKGDTPADAYMKTVGASVDALVTLLARYALDGVCHDLLPPCPPDPCDDRLILACVTVRNGRIIDVCNVTCRPFAGSFPTMNYWLSAVPLAAYLRALAGRLCCGEGLLRRGDVAAGNDALATLDTSAGARVLRHAVVDGGFALPSQFAAAVEGVLGALDPGTLAGSVEPGALNVATLAGQKVEAAQRLCEESGVGVVLHPLDGSNLPAFGRLTAPAFAARGDFVTLHLSEGQVVAAVAMTEAQAAREEVKALRAQVESLTRAVDARRNPGG